MNAHSETPPIGNVILVAAPSGAGKSSLVSALLATDPALRLSISCTTRAPRPGEEDGRDYHFISEAAFRDMQENNGLLEWAKVHDNYYGTPRQWIVETAAQGHDVVLEIDWQGARQVRAHFAHAIGIFIVPPSIETLEQRLTLRGQDAPHVIARRLMAAGSEIARAPEFEYVIINQDFSTALSELATIVRASRLRYASQAARHTDLFAQLGIPVAGAQ